MDITSLRFLLAFTIRLSLHMYLLDVVTTYLHGILDTILYVLFHMVHYHMSHLLNLVDILVLGYTRPYMALNSLAKPSTITYVIFWFLKVSSITLPTPIFLPIPVLLDLL